MPTTRAVTQPKIARRSAAIMAAGVHPIAEYVGRVDDARHGWSFWPNPADVNQMWEETMWLRLFVSALLLAVPMSGKSADIPKEGTETLTDTWVLTYISRMKIGDRFRSIYEQNGIARSDNGNPIFNNLGLRCLGTTEITAGKYSGEGTCTYTDKDGDQIMSTYEVKTQNAGTGAYVSGTGKFTGISGTGEWTVTARPTSADDKVIRGVVSEKVHWSLP
ncbi:MAG TPA: hypothetical protein VNW90_26440 [Acetobacteraceae bacterium]|jgi:hypothetical protein|nr:hypothetical protein [Acetobacteraceae bacterium]